MILSYLANYPVNLWLDLLLVSCCGYAWLRGGSPERAVATIYFAGVFMTLFAQRASGGEWNHHWDQLPTATSFVDLAVLAALLTVALQAERHWPIWFAALHLLGTFGELLRTADPGLARWSYAFVIAAGSCPMLLLLAFGTWSHQQRLRQFGYDTSWTGRSMRG